MENLPHINIQTTFRFERINACCGNVVCSPIRSPGHRIRDIRINAITIVNNGIK